MYIDTVGYKIIYTLFMSELGEGFAKFITNFGGALYLCLIALILLIVIKDKRIGLVIWLNLIIEALLNVTLKNIIQRPRPEGYRLISETGFSFPSGHSMASMAFYGLLIYLIYKNVKNKYLKWVGIIALSLLIIMIGASRIYLGVHYTSDVLGGFGFSIFYLILYINIISKILNKGEIK